MSTVKLNTKVIEALNKFANKNDIRYYANGVYLCKERNSLVVSDSLTLIEHKLSEKTEIEESTILSKVGIEPHIKANKALKNDTVELELNSTTTINGKYPPFESAYPKNDTFTVPVNLGQLKKVVDTLIALYGKDANTLLTCESAIRPVMLSVKDTQALIVSKRFDSI